MALFLPKTDAIRVPLIYPDKHSNCDSALGTHKNVLGD
jgi:hypothetical protein